MFNNSQCFIVCCFTANNKIVVKISTSTSILRMSMDKMVVKKNICRKKSVNSPTTAKRQNSWMAGTNVKKPTVKINSSVAKYLKMYQPSLLRPASTKISAQWLQMCDTLSQWGFSN